MVRLVKHTARFKKLKMLNVLFGRRDWNRSHRTSRNIKEHNIKSVFQGMGQWLDSSGSGQFL